MSMLKETFDFAKRQISISDRYESNSDVILFEGNCSTLLKDIPSDSVDLVITSPPYNGRSFRPIFWCWIYDFCIPTAQS